jgi:heterotetrameric sarcosine oxidase gamma subunit
MPRRDLAVLSVTAGKGCGEALVDVVRRRYGLVLPDGPRHTRSKEFLAVGIGPDRWLILSEVGALGSPAEAIAETVDALAAVVDLSDARPVLRVWGPAIRQVLAKGLPIDLHPRCFGPGDAATSDIAQINVHLWQIDETPSFEIAVPRGAASCFVEWLSASAAEFGMMVMP